MTLDLTRESDHLFTRVDQIPRLTERLAYAQRRRGAR
jgi:hypothetical protein